MVCEWAIILNYKGFFHSDIVICCDPISLNISEDVFCIKWRSVESGRRRIRWKEHISLKSFRERKFTASWRECLLLTAERYSQEEEQRAELDSATKRYRQFLMISLTGIIQAVSYAWIDVPRQLYLSVVGRCLRWPIYHSLICMVLGLYLFFGKIAVKRRKE